MIKAKIRPFCIAHIKNIGFFNGKDVYSRSVTEKKKALLSNNSFVCPKWKSDGVEFFKANEEIKSKNTTVNNYISPDNVTSFFKIESKPKKIGSQ